MYELGFSRIDMETYFVIISHRAFSSCRRLNEESIGNDEG